MLDLQATKEPFKVSTFFSFVQEAAADIRSQSKDILGVEVILRNLQQTLQNALSAALEGDNLLKGETYFIVGFLHG